MQALSGGDEMAGTDLHSRHASHRDDAGREDARQPLGGCLGRRGGGFPGGNVIWRARRRTRAWGSAKPNLLHASLQMDFGEVGRRYLAAVRYLAGGQRYTIDKLPFNFRYCGLIHQALPNAAIVHLTRDPMDTCYAVFKTLFINTYHFSYQLDEIAEYFIAYRRMMDHWHSVMPGVILDVRYEDLVADPADARPATARALRTALGRSGARFSQLNESVHDSERDAGAQADLQVVRAEVAQLHTRAATGSAAAGRSRHRRR